MHSLIAFLGLGGSEILILIPAVFILYCVSRIAKQAGHSGWWWIAALIPVVNLIVFSVFAFTRWPIKAPSTKRVRQLDPGQSEASHEEIAEMERTLRREEAFFPRLTGQQNSYLALMIGLIGGALLIVGILQPNRYVVISAERPIRLDRWTGRTWQQSAGLWMEMRQVNQSP